MRRQSEALALDAGGAWHRPPRPPAAASSSPPPRPPWLRQWVAAVRVNLDDDTLRAVAEAPVEPPFDVVAGRVRAEAAAVLVRTVLPYRFTGADPILALRDARRRGFGACGDGSAAVAAVGLLSGSAVVLHYETVRGLATYAHVAVDVDGFRADPYPDASIPARAPAVSDDVRELLGWRTGK